MLAGNLLEREKWLLWVARKSPSQTQTLEKSQDGWRTWWWCQASRPAGSGPAEESGRAAPAASGSSACGRSLSSPPAYTLEKSAPRFAITHVVSTVPCFCKGSKADSMDLGFRMNWRITLTQIIIRIKKFNVQSTTVKISNFFTNSEHSLSTVLERLLNK